VFCIKCGEEIDESHEFCPKCGHKKNEIKSQLSTSIEKKSVPLTIVLSVLLEGLGHLYIEQTKKGAIFAGIGLALWAFTFIDIFALIVSLPFWGWVLYDAYKQVTLYNKFVEENGKKPEW